MAAPRFRLARNSDVRVETQTRQDVARLLLLIALLHLCCRDGADLIRLYRRWRNRASAFFDACLSGEIAPVANRFQADMNALMPEGRTAHLYLPEWGGSEPSDYASLIKGDDGLWRLRHRRLRPVPGTPARDGVMILWGDVTPSPDVAVARTPMLSRVLTGGVGCAEFGAEAENNFEVRRQLSQAVIVAQFFDALHHDRLVTLHDPGKVMLRVNTTVGDGWTHPHEFTMLASRPYAPARTQKARVTVWATASDAGLYAPQTPRCILPSVKGAVRYSGDAYDRTEGKLLSELLLSRLLPFVGVLRSDQTVDVYGLHYDIDQGRGVVAEFAVGLPLRSCKGLPLLRPSGMEGGLLVWMANTALMSILREAVYDPSPDSEARIERWHSLRLVLRGLGAASPKDYPAYFAGQGLLLPDGAERHLTDLVAGEREHFSE